MATFDGSRKDEARSMGRPSPETRLHPLLSPLLLACVAAAPILIPPIFSNAVPGDVLNAAFIALSAVVLWRARTPLATPLGLSYVLYVLGGILALPQSVDPSTSALTLVEDVYLFAWFVLITNSLGLRSGVAPRLFCGVWVVTGFAVALLAWLSLLGYPDHVLVFIGWPTVSVNGRAMASLRDPNLAGNYLVISLFVLWAAPRPTKPSAKGLLSIPFLLGIAATYSNTALLSLLGGSIVALAIKLLGRHPLRVAITLALAAGTVLLLIASDQPFARRYREIASSFGRTEVLSRSIGRLDDSAADRRRRWQQALYLFGGQVVWGIGPASTTQAVASLNAPITGELHSDYLAGFVERGILGGLGVASLFAVVALSATKIALDRTLHREGWRPGALMGGAAAILMSAATLEVLHFRHVWLYFALLMALRPRSRIQPTTAGAGDESL
jgi:O-antigen ligase/polysaccharide polymerase Wzy-like membrane protein